MLAFLTAAPLACAANDAGRYHPYLEVEIQKQLEIQILYTPTVKGSCARMLKDASAAIESACPVCRIVLSRCMSELSAELRLLQSDEPLSYPAARFPNGSTAYISPDPQLALAACQETDRRSDTITCFAPETPRPTSDRHNTVPVQQLASPLWFFIVAAGITWAVLLITIRLLHPKLPPGFQSLIETTGLILGDTIAFSAATLVTLFGHAAETPVPIKDLLAMGGVALCSVIWFWFQLEHYGRRRPYWDELRQIIKTLSVLALISAGIVFLANLQATRTGFLSYWAFLFACIPLGRWLIKRTLQQAGLWYKPAVIIGTGRNAQDAYRALASEKNLGYQLHAFIETHQTDAAREKIEIDGRAIPIYPSNRQMLIDTIRRLGNPQVVIAPDTLKDPENQRLIQHLSSAYPNLHLIPSIRGLPLFGMEVSHFFRHEILFLTLRNNLARRSSRWIKRGFDLVGATALLIALSPLFLVLTMLIRRTGGLAFYGHPRIGQAGERFKCLKFRSMRPDADKVLKELLANDQEARAEWEKDFKLKNDPRITPVGHFIRKTSLDELPQLINVIKGEMSLVGPRPVVQDELERYGNRAELYQQVRPGITGLWQISGRNDTTYQERVELDSWYIQNWSLWYDIAVLFRTVHVVFARKGAY